MRSETICVVVSVIREFSGGVLYPDRSDMMATTRGAPVGGHTMAMSLALPQSVAIARGVAVSRDTLVQVAEWV